MNRYLALIASLSLYFTLGLAHAAKPNIVVIYADDLGWAELGCYGQEKIKTPNLDALAKQGQRWTHFYSGAPVCSPSRNVLLTGMHTGQTEIQDLKRVNPSEPWNKLQGDWPITEKSYTLPEAMKKAGYVTGVFGKWGMGEYGTTGGPDKHGIDRFFGYTDHKMCHTYYPEYIWDDGKKKVINPPGLIGHASKPNGEVRAEDYEGTTHTSDLMADQMIEFVKKQSKGGKPFFVYYAPLEPHVAMQPLKKWVDMYPESWDTKPYRGGGYLPHPRPRAAYAGMISQLDYNVGRLLKTISDLKLDGNTIVIFSSDNGTTHDVGGVDHRFFDSVAGLRGLKGQMYEGGIRVPFIVRWTGKIKPAVIDQPAYVADIMPSLCDIAQTRAEGMNGMSLVPIWAGKTKSFARRTPMVWTGGGYGGQVAIRLGDKTVIRRNLLKNDKNTNKDKQPSDWEVYDISKDEKEKKNIAASEKDTIREAISILNREYRVANGYDELNYKAPSKVLGDE